MVPFEEKDSKVTLGCSHTFHYGCILQWNLTSQGDNHKACPLCRENVGIDEALTNINIAQPSLTQRQVIPQDHVGPDDLITNPDHGLSVRCLDCHSDFYQCDGCGINICSCPFQLDMRDWEGRRFHSPRNPFDEPINEAELEEGELPITYCSRCFTNREDMVLDFMMDDHGDGDIFYHQTMIEFYENFFNDKSGRDNTQIYARYPKYTFDEFRDHMEQLFQDEMSSGDNFIDLIDDDLYEDIEVDNIDPTFPAENQPQPVLESVPVPTAPPPLINLDELEEFIEDDNEPVPRREIHIQLPQIDNIQQMPVAGDSDSVSVPPLNEIQPAPENDGGDIPETFHHENIITDNRIRYLLRYMNDDGRNFISNLYTENRRNLINSNYNIIDNITHRIP